VTPGGSIAPLWWRLPSIAQRHLILTTIFLVTLTGIPITGLPVSSVPALIGAVACLLTTTVVAVTFPWRAWSARWQAIVPLGALVAVGLLRAGTGESTSPFSFLIIVWALAAGAQPSRRWTMWLVGAGCELMVFLPYLVLQDPAPLTAGVLLRALFTPLVGIAGATLLNEVTRRVRDRMDELADSADGLRMTGDVLSSVIEAVSEQSIIATDLDGLIEVFNPGAEKLLGVSRAAVVGTCRVTQFHRQEELDAVDDHGRSGFTALVEATSSGPVNVGDWTYVTADGRDVIVHLVVTPRYDRHGAVIGFLFVATDMTEAREVARLKDEFVSLISHELRTPLSSILGYLELVLDDSVRPVSAEQRRFLTIAERNAHRLGQLVGDLLFTAQVEAGEVTFEWREVDLASVVTASVDAAIPAAAAGGVRVETTLPDGPVLVTGDVVRLGQACDNLVSNAVKFTPRGGRVSVSLDVPAGEYAGMPHVVVTVTDTGIGIAAAEMEQLFTRFFRASTATNAAIPGVGLGLAITRTIVTAHRGTMNVSSVERSGSAFGFTLPLHQP